MMEMQKVLARFAQFAGLGEEEARRWRPLCEAAAGQVVRRLKPGIHLEEGEERLLNAAAAWALCDLRMMEGATGESDEVRVGEVSLKSAATRAGQENPAALRDHFLAAAADLLTPPCPVLIQAGEER